MSMEILPSCDTLSSRTLISSQLGISMLAKVLTQNKVKKFSFAHFGQLLCLQIRFFWQKWCNNFQKCLITSDFSRLNLSKEILIIMQIVLNHGSMKMLLKLPSLNPTSYGRYLNVSYHWIKKTIWITKQTECFRNRR